ncbi:MAG: hypothetical protein AAGC67_00670, partial [Myxococcota bacterium]
EHGFHDVDGHLGWPRLAVPVAAGLGQAWTAWEALRQWRAMRRRLRLGLVSAEVCNRFLLFGGLASCMLIAITGLFLAMTLGQGPVRTPWFVGVVALSGAAQALLLWLAFLPPAAYRRWLAASAAASPPASTSIA